MSADIADQRRKQGSYTAAEVIGKAAPEARDDVGKNSLK